VKAPKYCSETTCIRLTASDFSYITFRSIGVPGDVFKIILLLFSKRSSWDNSAL